MHVEQNSISDHEFYKINKFAEDNLIKSFTLDSYGRICTTDGVEILDFQERVLPVKFGSVKRGFEIFNSNIITLDGCPDSCSFFRVHDCNITNLVGGPSDVPDFYSISDSKGLLTSLSGIPKKLNILTLNTKSTHIDVDVSKIEISFGLNITIDALSVIDICKVFKFNNVELKIFSGNFNRSINILDILRIEGLRSISFKGFGDDTLTKVFSNEIQRQPNPKKRNLLRVAQELSNVGYHHLTIARQSH